MRIGIIGAKGLVGSAIFNRLKDEHYVVAITRQSYPRHIGAEYDVLINANGNSRKYWANQNPLEDYDLSVSSVMSSLFDFKYKKYIFISSIDAEEPRGHYGFNKRIAEDLVKQYADKWQIVRLCSVIGKNMNKGPVYDIKHGNPVYLTSGSTLQLITDTEMAEEINKRLHYSSNLLTRLYTKNIYIRDIGGVLECPVQISPKAREEIYRFSPGIGLKTSEQYLMQIT